MKKVLIVLTFVLCLLLSTMTSWADTELTTKEDPVNILNYVHFREVTTRFSINSGVANCATIAPIKSGDTVDYAEVTAYIKKSTGSTVKTFNEKVYPAAGRITWSDYHKLASRGTYYLQVIVKCYRNGKLIETLNETSKTDTY